MSQTHSVRIFTVECKQCGDLAIAYAAWKSKEKGYASEVLEVDIFCSNKKYQDFRRIEIPPDAIGCDTWGLEELWCLDLSGTPYAVSDAGIEPELWRNNRQ